MTKKEEKKLRAEYKRRLSELCDIRAQLRCAYGHLTIRQIVI